MLSKLSQGLQRIVGKITGAGVIDEEFIRSSIRELQKTLIAGDVNVRLVLELTKNIENRIRSEKRPRGISPKQHFVKIVYEELVKFLGEGAQVEIRPQRILLVGLYGHGKTTTAAKLARFFSKRGLKTALITTDTWRPAAYEQLRQLGQSIGVPVFGNPSVNDPVKILEEGLEEFKGYDVVIVDSAGRDSLNDELIDEIREIKDKLRPDNVWLVMGGDIGQAAESQAKAFNEAVGLTGIILTRMDSSAKGGGALAACRAAGVPVIFIGTGEKIDDLEQFNPEGFVSRLMGFPDLPALLSKVKEAMESSEEDVTPEELLKGKFNLKVFYKQLEATKKMGSLQKVLEMLGLGSRVPREIVEESEEKLKIYKVIMDSMTNQELENPEILNKSRIERIARGSGRSVQEVRELIRQYERAKKMLKKLKGGRRRMNIPGLPIGGIGNANFGGN